MSWFLRGLFGGIRTTPFPKRADQSAGVNPGLPDGVSSATLAQQSLASICPTGALVPHQDGIVVREERCIHCMRCSPGVAAPPLPWRSDVAWASLRSGSTSLGGKFSRSLHVRVVDAGDCGSCLSEIAHLNDPLYNMHRLGIFITPTPRLADVLLVVGPVTEHMRAPLREAYDAMPEPKRVLAVGACAASGGIFGPSFTSAAGAAEVIPVDIVLPGCPPPPLAILEALLVLCGQKQR
jgi:Ni,Fe-hydrogenase III small subunit